MRSVGVALLVIVPLGFSHVAVAAGTPVPTDDREIVSRLDEISETLGDIRALLREMAAAQQVQALVSSVERSERTIAVLEAERTRVVREETQLAAKTAEMVSYLDSVDQEMHERELGRMDMTRERRAEYDQSKATLADNENRLGDLGHRLGAIEAELSEARHRKQRVENDLARTDAEPELDN